jgi:hypothetical protein
MRRISSTLMVALVLAVMMLAMAAPVFAVGVDRHIINRNACTTGQADEHSPVIDKRCYLTAPPVHAANL